MSEQDRLGELLTWRAAMEPNDPRRALLRWAIGELEHLRRAVAAGIDAANDEDRENDRLRGLLARLELAGTSTPNTAPGCPVCNRLTHEAGCWLAAELHPER